MINRYVPGTYTIPELRIGKLVISDLELNVFSERPFPRDKIIVGFMGSSGKEPDVNGNTFNPTDEDKELGSQIGKLAALSITFMPSFINSGPTPSPGKTAILYFISENLS